MEFDLNILKRVELEMLKEFIRICKKHNLRYYLLGGSCLGAVRHKGFIPWDDDIDVGMPRSDYDIFMEIAQSELPNHLFLQNYNTDPQCPYVFAKLRNSSTTYIEKSVENFEINHGIYIDIFPLDGFTENKWKRKKFFFKNKIYKYRIAKTFNYEKFAKKKNIFKRIISAFFDCIISIYYRNLSKTIKKQDKLHRLFCFEKSNLVANHSGAWGKKEIVLKEYFGEGIYAIFEGIEVCLPKNYDKYLTSLYGDYMTPPPPEKRIGHHYYKVVDTTKPFTYYTKERNMDE